MTIPDDGPWHVVRYGDGDSLVICLDEAGNQRVAFMATPGCRDQQERRKVWKRIKANARLIAAAPDLLEVCQRLLDRGYVSKHIEEEHDDHMRLAAAIAKATGAA